MVTYCYLNGKIMSAAQARVSIYDIGLLRGFGIYEAMTTHNKKPFMLEDHLERFRRSAAFAGLKVPASDAEIKEAIAELIERNGYEETNVKFILTGGTAIGGIEYDPDFPTFYILAEEFSALPEEYLTNGAKVMLYEHLRQFPCYKTTNYINAVMLQKRRKDEGALEILYHWQGNVLECATSNFMIVKGGKVITAKENILQGITRKVTLDLARKAGIPVEEREVKLDELSTADEAFLTASFKEVVPVVRADDRKIGNGAVGPVSKRLVELFREFAKSY